MINLDSNIINRLPVSSIKLWSGFSEMSPEFQQLLESLGDRAVGELGSNELLSLGVMFLKEKMSAAGANASQRTEFAIVCPNCHFVQIKSIGG